MQRNLRTITVYMDSGLHSVVIVTTQCTQLTCHPVANCTLVYRSAYKRMRKINVLGHDSVLVRLYWAGDNVG